MIRLSASGERNIVLSVSYDDGARCARFIRRAYRMLSARRDAAIVSLRPSLDSLALEVRDGFDPSGLVRELESLELKPDAEPPPAPPLRVPVCYHPEVAPDLDSIARQCGLPVAEIAALHAAATYEVWMLGFMPGFPYLGKLNDRLTLPRKQRPSPRIAAGSVAVAEEFTGVYPFDSPGGWHILGRTPWVVTDYRRTPPWLFDYGMKVRFYPITIEEYRQSVSAPGES